MCDTDRMKRHITIADDWYMIRTWSDHEIAKLSLFVRRADFSPYGKIKNSVFWLSPKTSPNAAPTYACPNSDTPTSPNTALARKIDTTTSPSAVRMPRKVTLWFVTHKTWSVIYIGRPWFKMIRTYPTMKWQNWTRPFAELTFHPSATHSVWKSSSCRARAISQNCRSTPPNAAHAMKSDTPTSPNISQATKNDTPTSPNVAPATKSHTGRCSTCSTCIDVCGSVALWRRCPVSRQAWHFQHHGLDLCGRCSTCSTMCDTNHMKRQIQWRTIRPWFDNDPNISDHEIAKLNPSFAELTFPPWATHFVWKNSSFRVYTSPNAAPATKSDAPTLKCCACHENRRSNITKCRACNEKSQYDVWHKSHEATFTMVDDSSMWFDTDSRMNCSSRTRPFAEVSFCALEMDFLWRKKLRPGFLPKFHSGEKIYGV